MEYFAPNDKPPIEEVNAYFVRRLTPKKIEKPGIGLVTSHDIYGNLIFESIANRETLLHGTVPASLVVSQKGRDYFRRNRNLLRNIATGNYSDAEFVGERMEGKVYKIQLMRPSGALGNFALKYAFPIRYWHTEEPDYYFTSQIDQMRMQQQAKRDNPVPGLHMIVPLFATHDTTIRPLIQSGIPLGAVRNIGKNGEEDHLLKLSYEQTANIAEVKRKLEDDPRWQQFQNIYLSVVDAALEQLELWVKKTKADPAMSFISPRESISFDSGDSNTLVHMDRLLRLFSSYKLGEETVDLTDFDKRARETCSVLEIICTNI